MSLHIFGAIITTPGIAANNRGENDGNITTLQKILWGGQVCTTVSAEAIRWAVRYFWQMTGIPVNRVWDENKADHVWQDPRWQAWTDEKAVTKAFPAEMSKPGEGSVPHYIDDDILGFMLAEAAKSEGSDEEEPAGGKGKKAAKGTCDKRRGVLEIARAISLTPFAGDITFNAKSGEKGRTSLYGTEVHATRYQYGFAMTPGRARRPERVMNVLDAVAALGEVAGNHSRFLYDFSPESIVLRICHDPAPRILYCFRQADDNSVTIPGLIARIQAGDIDAGELYVGGPAAAELDKSGISPAFAGGVKRTVEVFKDRVATALKEG